jgi:uncharacterized membrane protein
MTIEAVRPEPVRERRGPRWMWIALVLSVGLNLLVAGVVASAAWRLRSGGGFGPHAQISKFLVTLPPERSEALRGVVDRSRQAFRPLRQEVWERRSELGRVIAAEPVDDQALEATLARLADAELKIRQAYAQLTIELAKGMTAGERQAFVEWQERRRARFRSREHDQGPQE